MGEGHDAGLALGALNATDIAAVDDGAEAKLLLVSCEEAVVAAVGAAGLKESVVGPPRYAGSFGRPRESNG